MDSIHNFVLSTFAPNDRFNNQIESLRRRYQILNLIYIQLLISLMIILVLIITAVVTPNYPIYFLVFTFFPFVGLSLILIHKRKLEMANIVLVLALHLTVKIINDYIQFPFLSILGLMIFPYYVLFTTSSTKHLILNFILSLNSYYSSAMEIFNPGNLAVHEEQTTQIIAFLWSGLVVICGISVLAISQKYFETKLWSFAQENYHKCENLNKEMILAMEAKDRFVSMVSHEIRNPLNTLKGSVDYLIQVEEDPNHLKILKNAQLSGEILLNLVNNVLDAAKLKSDKMEILRSQASFVDIVKKVFIVNSELLKNKNLVAKAHIDENLPENIWIDGSRLLQVLLNLISNAVKFTPSGGKIEIYAEWCSAQENKESLLKPIIALGSVENRIESAGTKRFMEKMEDEEEHWSFIETQEMSSDEKLGRKQKFEQISKYQTKKWPIQRDNDPWELNITKVHSSRGSLKIKKDPGQQGFLKVQVIDSGCGIAANEIPKLFGMFEQSTEHSRNVHGGSGLGLWICKQICQRMNGDIKLYSELGKGTSFIFYIPVHCSQGSRTVSEPSSTGKHQMRALVVDDFQSNRYIHKLLLEQQGVQVVTASEGEEAVDKYKASHEAYSFILMDVNMPVMDGFTAAKKIREWEIENKKKQTDIYFVTEEYFNEADVFMRFKSVGGSSSGIKYLNKPLDRDALKKIIIHNK